jgi:hypothetical protein
LGGFIAGLVLYTIASWQAEARRKLDEAGTDTSARVTRYWTSGRDPVRYWLEYSYRVEGRGYLGKLSTKRNAWLNLQRTGALKIRYLPADPQQNLVVGYEAGLMPTWISIIIAASLFAIALLLAAILARQRRLLAEGRPAPAVVTKVTRSADHGKKIAHYVFMEMTGKLMEGKSSPQKKPPAVGSVLNVIYEPDNENHNHIYPLSLFKTAR